jgi:hypothetical protein
MRLLHLCGGAGLLPAANGLTLTAFKGLIDENGGQQNS